VSEFSERGAFVIIQRFAFFKRRQSKQAITNLIGWIWIKKPGFAWLLGWHFELGYTHITSLKKGMGKNTIHLG
jgi:hypothetical protein